MIKARNWLTTGVVILGGMAVATALDAGVAHAQVTLVVANGTSPHSCAADAGYNTISAAVAAASTGDTIQVCAGTYPETVQVSTPGLIFEGHQAGVDPVNVV